MTERVKAALFYQNVRNFIASTLKVILGFTCAPSRWIAASAAARALRAASPCTGARGLPRSPAARKFLIWGYHKPVIGPVCKFFITKGEKGGRKLEEKAGKGLTVALLLFVGIPLPGTGAWTGTLAASILDMKFKDVLIACMGGVLLAGIIMGLASAGVLGAASSLFAV